MHLSREVLKYDQHHGLWQLAVSRTVRWRITVTMYWMLQRCAKSKAAGRRWQSKFCMQQYLKSETVWGLSVPNTNMPVPRQRSCFFVPNKNTRTQSTAFCSYSATAASVQVGTVAPSLEFTQVITHELKDHKEVGLTTRANCLLQMNTVCTARLSPDLTTV